MVEAKSFIENPLEKLQDKKTNFWKYYNDLHFEYAKIDFQLIQQSSRLAIAILTFSATLIGLGYDLDSIFLYLSWAFFFISMLFGFWLIKYQVKKNRELLDLRFKKAELVEEHLYHDSELMGFESVLRKHNFLPQPKLQNIEDALEENKKLSEEAKKYHEKKREQILSKIRENEELDKNFLDNFQNRDKFLNIFYIVLYSLAIILFVINFLF